MSTVAVRARTALLDPRQPARTDQVVLVDDGQIARTGAAAQVLPTLPAHVPVVGVATLLPGMTDAHSHGRSYPLSAQDLPGNADLLQALIEFNGHTAIPPHDDARVAGADLVATGVTAARLVHHSFGDRESYLTSLADSAFGFAQAGVAITVALGLTDQYEFLPPATSGSRLVDALLPPELLSPNRALTATAWTAAVAGVVNDPASYLGVRSWEVAPVNPLWCSPALLRTAGDLSEALDLGVHTHLLEAPWQRGDASACGSLRSCADAGLLTAQMSAAHAVWLDEQEISAAAAAGAHLVHCPHSNIRLRSGTAALRQWFDAGVPAAIGLDSNTPGTPDMFEALRAARELARQRGAPVTDVELLTAATVGGAATLRHPDWSGVITPGARADLVALSLESQPDAAARDIVDTATRHDVMMVWSAGTVSFDRTAREPNSVAQARRRVEQTLLADTPLRQRRLDRLRAAMPSIRDAWNRFSTPSETRR